MFLIVSSLDYLPFSSFPLCFLEHQLSFPPHLSLSSPPHLFLSSPPHRPLPFFPYKNIVMLRFTRETPAMWCSALMCIIYAVILLISGFIILITYLVVHPKQPVFDITHANFSRAGSYPDVLAEFAILANFSNPNKILNLKIEHASVQLLFEDTVIGNETTQPFSIMHKETKSVVFKNLRSTTPIKMPEKVRMEFLDQVLSNKVFFRLKGTFKVRSPFTYWVHEWCYLQVTSPPGGSLVNRICNTTK